MIKKLKFILKRFNTLLRTQTYKVSSKLLESKIGVFLSLTEPFIILLLIILGFGGCKSNNFVPIENSSTVVIRDSVIKVHDTIVIEVPKESIIEILPFDNDTTSILKTSLATSIASIENNRLYHSLEQDGTVVSVIDTFYVTKIEERMNFQYYPVEVIKEVKHIPNWVSYSLMFNIISLLLLGTIVYMKLK